MQPLPVMTQPDPQHEWFVAARGGDREALQHLARFWWPRLKRWALLELGDPTLADDACQEALVRLTREVVNLDDSRPLGAWLRTVVRNCCRNVGRSERRHQQGSPRTGKVVDLERELDLRRGANRMLHAFAQLTPRQREALDWVDRQGLTPTEAAARMDSAPGTVRALLHQGRSALRAHLLDDLHDLVRHR